MGKCHMQLSMVLSCRPVPEASVLKWDVLYAKLKTLKKPAPLQTDETLGGELSEQAFNQAEEKLVMWPGNISRKMESNLEHLLKCSSYVQLDGLVLVFLSDRLKKLFAGMDFVGPVKRFF